jgi:thioredoxin
MKETMNDSKPDPSTMKIKEIKDELTEMNISFAGCFDKESLMERLKDARSGKVMGAQTSTNTQNAKESQPPAPRSTHQSSFDREKVLMDLRSKTIKELRTMCAQAGIRWATMIEKEDYVKALLAKEEERGDFSPSGKLTPGKVGNISQDDVEKELQGRADTPLLLDVYATWCGPCKLMAPQLDEAASEWGSKIRVAKMDTDQNQELSSRLQIKGLPTIIIFDKNGKEIERVEGAMMKDQLGQFVNKYI